MSDKLKKEVESFDNIWFGGFCRSKMGHAEAIMKEEYGVQNDYGKTLIFSKFIEKTIEPYITEDTVALDIGTDGGFWAAYFHKAKSIIGMDIRPAEHTGYFQNLQKWDIVPNECLSKYSYHMNRDFSCSTLEDNSIDYVFSFDVFCHISLGGQEQYLKNLFSKLKPGANLFIMIADAEEYTSETMRNQVIGSAARNGITYSTFEDAANDYDGPPYPGRWYWVGKDRFCKMAVKYGYEIVDPNCCNDIVKFSPVIHFRKPMQ